MKNLVQSDEKLTKKWELEKEPTEPPKTLTREPVLAWEREARLIFESFQHDGDIQ